MIFMVIALHLIVATNVYSADRQLALKRTPSNHRRIQSDSASLQHPATIHSRVANATWDTPPAALTEVISQLATTSDTTSDHNPPSDIELGAETIGQFSRGNSTDQDLRGLLSNSLQERPKPSFYTRHKHLIKKCFWGATALTIAGLAIHGAIIVHDTSVEAAQRCDNATKNCAESAEICTGVLTSLGQEAQTGIELIKNLTLRATQAEAFIDVLKQNISAFIDTFNFLSRQNELLRQELIQCQELLPTPPPFPPAP